MTSDAPISRHLELFRYWSAKRGARPMPARSDIDPAEIRSLLPHLALVERDRDTYRWRLMGTAISAELGRDLTGQALGGYINNPDFLKAMFRTFDDILTSGRPMLEESVYRKDERSFHASSRLNLPLTTEGTPAIIIFSRVTKRSHDFQLERNWAQGIAGRICATHPIATLDELEHRAAAWDQTNR